MAGDNSRLQYIIELLTQGDTSKARDEIGKLDKTAKSSGDSMAALATKLRSWFIAFGGVAAIKSSLDAFTEAEKVVTKLNAALRSTNQFTPELSERLQDLAGSLAQVTAFNDEEILNVVAKLTANGAAPEQVGRLTEAILDLSTLMDRDLNRATAAMAKALSGGGVEAFKELGFAIDSTLLPSQQFEQVLSQLSDKAGGQAKAAAESLGFQYELLKKQIGETQEAFGQIIISGLDPFIKKVNEAHAATNNWIKDGLSKLKFLGQIATTKGNPLLGLGEALAGNPATHANFLAELIRGTIAGARAGATDVPSAGSGGVSAAKSPGLAQADMMQWFAIQEELDKEVIDSINKEWELRQKISEQSDRLSLQEQDQVRDFHRLRMQQQDDFLLSILSGADKERAQIEISHRQRVQAIQDAQFANEEMYAEAMTAEERLYQAQKRTAEAARSWNGQMVAGLKDVERAGTQAFASGLSTAIVDAFEEGDKAFEKFAANFLKQIAQMILQTLILRAIQSGLGFAAANGGQFTAMANGGMIRAAGGVPGVSDVSNPTFFPRFNVLAGEAGREVLTVLSRPRLMDFGGLQAQVGFAGGRALAITSAQGLAAAAGGAGSGANGTITIEVRTSARAEAELVQSSVRGARVQLLRDIQQDTPTSRAIRKLS